MEQIGLEWIRMDWKELGQIERDQNGLEWIRNIRMGWI